MSEFIWIDSEHLVNKDMIKSVYRSKTETIFFFGTMSDISLSNDDGEHIIAQLERGSVERILTLRDGKTINPEDITSSRLYGEGEMHQVITLTLRGGTKIDVGTAWDLSEFETVHNFFLTNRPPFKVKDWIEKYESKAASAALDLHTALSGLIRGDEQSHPVETLIGKAEEMLEKHKNYGLPF